jgi:UDP-N-acetylmuramoyl-tripeptide--D-alanyl-D-alanine ligase
MRLSLDDILAATGGRLRWSGPARTDVIVTGISTDTRTLRAGDLFVPLHGPHADGHSFLSDAVSRGAAAALWAHQGQDVAAPIPLVQVADPLVALGALAAYYRNRLPTTVVAITGSVGKTTTTTMTATVLSKRFRTVATRSEWNAEVGVPLTVLSLSESDEIAVIEMAMRGLGQIAELVEIARPSIGVVTTVGESHLEFLGTKENIARAKGELIAGLPSGGTAVLNGDDAAVMELAKLCRGRVLTYRLDGHADVDADQVHTTHSGVRFHVHAGGQAADVKLRTWGRHNVRNALAAAAVGLVMGMNLQDIVRGLEEVHLPHGRLEPVRFGDILVLNDTYNASPASVRAALAVLSDLAPLGHRIAVLGEMRELGPASAALHSDLGQVVASVGVRLLLTVGEEARALGDGAAAAGLPAQAIAHVSRLEEAVPILSDALRPHDVVLIKGSRALEMERIVERLQSAHPATTSPTRGPS